MALTERTFTDQITVEPHTGIVLWRRVTVIERDGVEIHRGYTRGSHDPAFDLPADLPAEVEAHRALVQTPAIVAAARKRREDYARAFEQRGRAA